MTHASSRTLTPALLVLSALLVGPVKTTSAQTGTPPPITLGHDVVFSTAIRSRTYNWNWFGDTPQGDYTYQGTQVRFGLSQVRKRYDWQVEFEVPFMIGLPSTAVQPAPKGQLGLGGSYFAANNAPNTTSTNPADIFLKQAFVRFKDLGGVTGQSLKIGRQEFNDALEATPKDSTLAVLNRDRVSQRLLGNFGFSDVLRSLDGVQYGFNRPTLNVTAVAARPTQGVFQVDGWSELDINVFYGSVTGQGGSASSPTEWRIFAIGYDDCRHGVLKTDNRSAAARTADTQNIAIGTYGGNILQLVPTPSGPIDLLFWGALQSGSWGTLSHRAGAYAAEAGWQPAGLPALKPWIRGGYDYSSGDSNPNDGDHGTFFQMLPTARIYARMPFFNLMNNTDAFGELILRPMSRLTLRTDVHAIGLADSHDLWYGGGGAFQPLSFGFTGRPSNGHTGLATLYDFSADITINPHLAVNPYYAYAHSQAVAQAIFPTSAGAHLFFLEWTVRF